MASADFGVVVDVRLDIERIARMKAESERYLQWLLGGSCWSTFEYHDAMRGRPIWTTDE